MFDGQHCRCTLKLSEARPFGHSSSLAPYWHSSWRFVRQVCWECGRSSIISWIPRAFLSRGTCENSSSSFGDPTICFRYLAAYGALFAGASIAWASTFVTFNLGAARASGKIYARLVQAVTGATFRSVPLHFPLQSL